LLSERRQNQNVDQRRWNKVQLSALISKNDGRRSNSLRWPDSGNELAACFSLLADYFQNDFFVIQLGLRKPVRKSANFLLTPLIK